MPLRDRTYMSTRTDQSLLTAQLDIMQPFKEHLALMFFKGALLDDEEGLLRSQGENTQAALRIEFTSVEQVTGRSAALKSYVEKAIAIEEAGLEVPTRPTAPGNRE